jgi:hypothetical protein
MAVKFSEVCTGHVLEELVLIEFKNFFVDQLVPLAFGVRPNNLRVCIALGKSLRSSSPFCMSWDHDLVLFVVLRFGNPSGFVYSS